MTQVEGTVMNLAGSAKSLLLTVIGIALIISAFGIINTLLMSVNERTKEFGMMKAIGASGLDIGKMVLGLVCGLYPAFKSSRLTPMEAIRGGVE